MSNKDKLKTGQVVLVGAGIGDPDLITVAGLKALERADVVFYDALANPKLLEYADADSEKIYVGKRGGEHRLKQEEINKLLAQKAKSGLYVVRLKGGDPYLFGRGAEELTYIADNGVTVSMIPGITSGIAGPAFAGIPVTHRNLASTVTFITGHEDPTKQGSSVDYSALAKMIKIGGTACFYMGVGKLEKNCKALIKAGLDKDTPSAAVQWASTPKQKSITCTLSNITQKVSEAGISSPAIIVVGNVAGIKQTGLKFFENRPLFGKTIIVTRSRSQSSTLKQKLEALGADVLEAPTIDIKPARPTSKLDGLIKDIDDYNWLIITSANAVAPLKNKLTELGLDSRALANVKIAAVGKATNQSLKEQLNITADFVPTKASGQALGQELIGMGAVKNKKVILLRGDLAGAHLPELLQNAGAIIEEHTIYFTHIADSLPGVVLENLRDAAVDWVTFTSSSTAHNMAKLLGNEKTLLNKCKLASIGEMTSAAIDELGFNIDAQAKTPGIDNLIEAMLEKENY